jgi:hypothetical protein
MDCHNNYENTRDLRIYLNAGKKNPQGHLVTVFASYWIRTISVGIDN